MKAHKLQLAMLVLALVTLAVIISASQATRAAELWDRTLGSSRSNSLSSLTADRLTTSPLPLTLELIGDNFDLSSGATTQRVSPFVAYNSTNNEYMVVWFDYRNPYNNDVFGQRVSATGTLLGTNIPVIELAEAQVDPFVAYDSINNEYLAAWKTQQYGCFNCTYGRRISGNGTPLGSDFSILGGGEEVSIAYNPTATEYLVTARGLGIQGRRVSGGGSPIGSEITIATAGAPAPNGQVVYNPNHNEYLATWCDQEAQNLQGQRISANGSLVGSPIVISSLYPESSRPTASVAFDPINDRYLVTFGRFQGMDIWGQFVSSSGTLIGTNFTIATGLASRAVPYVAYSNADHVFVIVWRQGDDIVAQLLSDEGSLVGDPLAIASGTASSDPTLAYNSQTGGFLVVWSDKRNIPLGEADIFGQLIGVCRGAICLAIKAATQSTILPGAPVSYTVVLTNGGAIDMTDVHVTDTLPISLTYTPGSLVATSGNYGYSSGVITWTGTISVGELVTITFKSTAGYTLGAIVNSAVISGGGEVITRGATVNVISPVESAVISNTAKGYLEVGYPFTATVSPITATFPITYLWEATEQLPVTHSNDSLTDPITFTWNTTGTKSITVTAINIGGMVTNTHAITIETLPKVYLPIVTRQFCPLLYSDNFGNPASGWPINDTGSALYEYSSGEYRILLRDAPYEWAGARPGYKASDYSAVVDVRNASGSGVTGYYGILFGISDDWSQAYLFWISSFGYTGISRYNSSSGWSNLTNRPSTYINPGAATNRLKVEHSGSQITGYVNGLLEVDFSDSSYTGLRHVGLGVTSSSQPNVDARFDNFAVYPVGCGAATTAFDETSETPEGEATEADLSETWKSDRNRQGR
jgi:uncharacterized repeat protein (TIGR01451 family)